MSYAEDSAVPEASAGNHVIDDPYNLHGDTFGIGVAKGDSSVALLTRSSSRKRLTPEILAANADAALPRGGALAWDSADDPALSALLLGYQSCPGVVQHPDAFHISRRPRAGNGVRGASRAAAGAGAMVCGSGPGKPPHPRPTSEPDTHAHEVPVLAPATAHATITMTTAGSAFCTSATSAGHAPSAPPPPWRPNDAQLSYSELLSGPGFSYAADGNGFFEADAISLGSLGSGSLGSGGYMLGSDDEDDDEFEEDFRITRSRSAGTACSGSGERVEAAAMAAVADEAAAMAAVVDEAAAMAAAVDATPKPAPQPILSCGSGSAAAAAAAVASQPDGAPAVGVVTPWFTSGGGGAAAAVKVGVTAAADFGATHVELRAEAVVAAAAEEEEDGKEACLPARSASTESVGSADVGDCRASSCVSHAAQVVAAASTAAAAVPRLPPPVAADFGVPATGTVAAAFEAVNINFHPAAAVAAALQPVGAVLGAPERMVGVAPAEAHAWASSGVPHLQHPAAAAMADEGSVAAAATAAMPLIAAVPSLLPPEVYLGFVSQLVESVRTATRAVDEACQAERQGGCGFAGQYAAAAATGGIGSGAVAWVPGGGGGGGAIAPGPRAEASGVHMSPSSSSQGREMRGGAGLGVARWDAAGA